MKLNWVSGLKVNFAFQTYHSTVTIHQLIINLTTNQIWVAWIWIWFIRIKQSFDWKVRFVFDFWFEILNWKTDLMIDKLFIDWLKVKFKWFSKSHNQLIKLFCRSSKLLWNLQIGLLFVCFQLMVFIYWHQWIS